LHTGIYLKNKKDSKLRIKWKIFKINKKVKDLLQGNIKITKIQNKVLLFKRLITYSIILKF